METGKKMNICVDGGGGLKRGKGGTPGERPVPWAKAGATGRGRPLSRS